MADGLCGLKTQATKPLRQVMSATGVQLEEYALHPQRIEGATHLSPAGASSEVVKRDGRWASGVYQGYVHNQGRNAPWVSGEMEDRSDRVSRSSQGKGLCGTKYKLRRKAPRVSGSIHKRRRGRGVGRAHVRQVTHRNEWEAGEYGGCAGWSW